MDMETCKRTQSLNLCTHIYMQNQYNNHLKSNISFLSNLWILSTNANFLPALLNKWISYFSIVHTTPSSFHVQQQQTILSICSKINVQKNDAENCGMRINKIPTKATNHIQNLNYNIISLYTNFSSQIRIYRFDCNFLTLFAKKQKAAATTTTNENQPIAWSFLPFSFVSFASYKINLCALDVCVCVFFSSSVYSFVLCIHFVFHQLFLQAAPWSLCCCCFGRTQLDLIFIQLAIKFISISQS